MKRLVWGFLLVVLCVHAYATTVGDSHNRIDAVGRNRANVIYTMPKAATQPENAQPFAQPVQVAAGVVTETETVTPPAPQPAPDLTPDLIADIAMASEYIARLQDEIKQIDSEIARCKKAKSNWAIGTVVGTVGAVGTATGAIVQAVQINKAKKNGATETADNNDNDAKEKE